MSYRTQFFPGNTTPPTSIINKHSAGGASVGDASNYISNLGLSKQFLSGALTATVYKEVLAVSDSGVISWCSAYTINATARTIGLKIVIDGVTVFDAVTNSVSTTSHGIVAIGETHSMGGSTTNTLGRIFFNTSLSVQVKSSLSETNFVAMDISYITT